MAKNKLFKVVYKNNSHTQYVFYGDSSIEEKDIVISEKTSLGYPSIGIVVNADVDPSDLNNCGCFFPLKKVFFLCKSSHDLTASRNIALKSILAVYDISFNELLDTYKQTKEVEKNDGLPS